MMGELDAAEIDELLRSEVVGRIGCVTDGWPYIVPITYVYDGQFVYAHTGDGTKLRAMQHNPQVCFEVEQIRSMSNWRTVVARGHFEQLASEEEERAMALLQTRLSRLESGASAQWVRQEDVHRRAGFARPILFRIRLEERTGRFELV